MVGAMRVDVLGDLVLILRRRRDASIYPILGCLERYV